jgi:hypothetical protein
MWFEMKQWTAIFPKFGKFVWKIKSTKFSITKQVRKFVFGFNGFHLSMSSDLPDYPPARWKTGQKLDINLF